MPAIKYYWEDMTVGSVRDLGTASLTTEEIKEFAAKYDPQPFHLDEEAARHSMFGALCASGWQTCSLAMGMTVRGFLQEAASLGSPGLESLKWLKPVYPGDTLHLRQVILESRPLRSRPDVGIVRTRWEMSNQRGEPVMQMEGYGMFRRRHPASADEGGAEANTG